MSISVQCDCGKKLKAPDKAAGKTKRCPDCGEPLTVPKKSARERAREQLVSATEYEQCSQCGEPIAAGDGMCDLCAGGLAGNVAKQQKAKHTAEFNQALEDSGAFEAWNGLVAIIGAIVAGVVAYFVRQALQ